MAYARSPLKGYVNDAWPAEAHNLDWDAIVAAGGVSPKQHQQHQHQHQQRQHQHESSAAASPPPASHAAGSPGVATSSRMRMSSLVALVAKQEGAVRNGEIQIRDLRNRVESLQDEVDDKITALSNQLVTQLAKRDEAMARMQTEFRERCTKIEEQQYNFRYSQQAREYDTRQPRSIFQGVDDAPASTSASAPPETESARDRAHGGTTTENGNAEAFTRQKQQEQQLQQQQQQMLSTINAINETVVLVHQEIKTMRTAQEGTARESIRLDHTSTGCDDDTRSRRRRHNARDDESLYDRVSAILQRKPDKRLDERRHHRHFHPLVSAPFIASTNRVSAEDRVTTDGIGKDNDGIVWHAEDGHAGRSSREDLHGRQKIQQMRSSMRKFHRSTAAPDLRR